MDSTADTNYRSSSPLPSSPTSSLPLSTEQTTLEERVDSGGTQERDHAAEIITSESREASLSNEDLRISKEDEDFVYSDIFGFHIMNKHMQEFRVSKEDEVFVYSDT